jgi:predicted nucleic acid-binding protein
MVEALVGQDPDPKLLEALSGDVDAPHLLDVEVLSALRGLVLGGRLDANLAEVARVDHFALSINRHDTAPFAHRIWTLRHRFTTYDACYLALAEVLAAPLFTYDAKLAAGGHEADVRVLPGRR